MSNLPIGVTETGGPVALLLLVVLPAPPALLAGLEVGRLDEETLAALVDGDWITLVLVEIDDTDEVELITAEEDETPPMTALELGVDTLAVVSIETEVFGTVVLDGIELVDSITFADPSVYVEAFPPSIILEDATGSSDVEASADVGGSSGTDVDASVGVDASLNDNTPSDEEDTELAPPIVACPVGCVVEGSGVGSGPPIAPRRPYTIAYPGEPHDSLLLPEHPIVWLGL